MTDKLSDVGCYFYLYGVEMSGSGDDGCTVLCSRLFFKRALMALFPGYNRGQRRPKEAKGGQS